MFKFIRSRIGLKLSLFFLFALSLTAAALIKISTHLVISFGEFSASQSESTIRSQAYNYLKRITKEQAEKYGSHFQGIAAFPEWK